MKAQRCVVYAIFRIYGFDGFWTYVVVGLKHLQSFLPGL